MIGGLDFIPMEVVRISSSRRRAALHLMRWCSEMLSGPVRKIYKTVIDGILSGSPWN